jgi:hypothetical protein
MASGSSVYAKTNTRLPDQLPALEDIRFDPLGGPFPVFGKNSHASDPHGLNAYLMHPEDQLWNYLQPRPRNASFADSETSKSDSLSRSPIIKSPLGRPPLILSKPPPAAPIDFSPREVEAVVDPTVKKASFKSKLGFGKGFKSSKSSTSLVNLVESGPSGGSRSQPSSPTRMRSIPLAARIEEEEDVTRESQVMSPETVTSDADERTIKGSPPTIEQTLLSPETTPVEPRPGNPSRWSWLGMGPKQPKKKASGSVPVKKPTNLHEATPLNTGLSADPLAGVLPSSIPADATPVLNDSLNLPTRTRSPMPESVRALRIISIKKLSALRAPSPHPIMPETSIPAYLAHHGVETSQTKRMMRFPRSVNSRQLPGMGLGPAEAGMRIDVSVRALLSKMDSHHAQLDLSEISAAVALAPTNGKRLPNGLTDMAKIKLMLEQNAKRGPGVPAFLARPGFEDRMWCYDENGEAAAIVSDRAVYEIEFSEGLEALGEEATRLARDGRSRLPSRHSTYDIAPGRPIQAGSRSGSREALNDDDVRYGKAEAAPATPSPTLASSESQIKFPSTQTTSDSPIRPVNHRASTIATRKQKPINWTIASDSESSESESEESESDDDRQPLSRIGSTQRLSEMVAPKRGLEAQPLSAPRPSVLSRPQSLAVVQQTSARLVAVARPPMDRRTTEERRKTEADLSAQYREHVMQTRQRRDQARVGVVERQRTGDALRDKERERRRSLAGITPLAVPERALRSVPNTSTPVSPNHIRTNSDASMPNSSSTGRIHRKMNHPESSRLNPNTANPSLSRRSMSYADVRASTYLQNFPPSHAPPFLSHSMSFGQPQQSYMYVPVPVMHYPQPGMGFMPMQAAMMPQHMPQHMPQDPAHIRRNSNAAPALSPNHTGTRQKTTSGGQAPPTHHRGNKRTPVQ